MSNMFFLGKSKNLCKICRKDFGNYRPIEDRDCGLCFGCFKQYKENVIKSKPDPYKKFIAKMAFKEIKSVLDVYKSKENNLNINWEGCIKVDDELFTERELKEDEGE